jgi:hypothetical protein
VESTELVLNSKRTRPHHPGLPSSSRAKQPHPHLMSLSITGTKKSCVRTCAYVSLLSPLTQHSTPTQQQGTAKRCPLHAKSADQWVRVRSSCAAGEHCTVWGRGGWGFTHRCMGRGCGSVAQPRRKHHPETVHDKSPSMNEKNIVFTRTSLPHNFAALAVASEYQHSRPRAEERTLNAVLGTIYSFSKDGVLRNLTSFLQFVFKPP